MRLLNFGTKSANDQRSNKTRILGRSLVRFLRKLNTKIMRCFCWIKDIYRKMVFGESSSSICP